jgi:hypothetical protein
MSAGAREWATADERRFLQVAINPARFSYQVGRMPTALSAFIGVHLRFQTLFSPRQFVPLPIWSAILVRAIGPHRLRKTIALRSLTVPSSLAMMAQGDNGQFERS